MTTIQNIVFVVVLAIVSNIWYQRSGNSGPTLATTLNSTYDYIVVGAGSAGAVIASRLSENDDVTVLLLEAGGSDWGNINIETPAYSTNTFHTEVDWEYYSEPQNGVLTAFKDGRSFWPRGKTLGGTMSINGMQFVRGSRHDFDMWAEFTGDKGWDYKHVLPYFKKFEDVSGVSELRGSAYRGEDGPLTINRLAALPLNDKIVEGFEAIGLPYNPDYNGKTYQGISSSQVHALNGERLTTARAFLYPASDRPNLDVSVYSHVTKLVIKDKKAVGVEVIKNGRKFTIGARKEVIVSAGAIGSPQILMLSGVGPKKHLETLKIPVVADLPVGDNLMDHLMFEMPIEIKEPLSYTWDSYDSWWNRLRFRLFGTGPLEAAHLMRNLGFICTTKEFRDKDWPDVEFITTNVVTDHRVSDIWCHSEETKARLSGRNNAKYGLTIHVCLNRPESRGTLRLKSSDPFDYPILKANYFEKQEDIEVMIRGVNEVKKFVDSQPMKDIGAKLTETSAIPPCDKHRYDSHEYWECLLKDRPLTIYHYSGTCKMGPVGDPTTVVDSQLRVKGISGLRVADASVMPYITSGNTNAATIMIAEKASDLILGKTPPAPINV